MANLNFKLQAYQERLQELELPAFTHNPGFDNELAQAQRTDAKPGDLLALAACEDEAVRMAVLMHPAAPEKVLHIAQEEAKSGWGPPEAILSILAIHPGSPQSLLEMIRHFGEKKVYQLVNQSRHINWVLSTRMLMTYMALLFAVFGIVLGVVGAGQDRDIMIKTAATLMAAGPVLLILRGVIRTRYHAKEKLLLKNLGWILLTALLLYFSYDASVLQPVFKAIYSLFDAVF